MSHPKDPGFKKSRSLFNEVKLEYTPETLSPEFFQAELANATSLLTDINTKCNHFHDFNRYLNYRRYAVFAMFFLLPLMFLLGVIGFTSQAFILSWFFFTFLFFGSFFFFSGLYFLTSRINQQFLIYAQAIQEIIDKYNIEWFIEKGMFVYFRTKSVDSWAAPSQKSSLPAQQKLGFSQISLKFRFFVQSRLLRIIRNFFWIEFLRFSEHQGPLPKSLNLSPIRNSQYSDSEQPQQQVSGIKPSSFSQNHYSGNKSGLNISVGKSPQSGYSAGKSQSNKKSREQEIIEERLSHPIHEESPQFVEPEESPALMIQREPPREGEQEGSTIYRNNRGSPNVMRFEESSESKSQHPGPNDDENQEDHRVHYSGGLQKDAYSSDND